MSHAPADRPAPAPASPPPLRDPALVDAIARWVAWPEPPRRLARIAPPLAATTALALLALGVALLGLGSS